MPGTKLSYMLLVDSRVELVWSGLGAGPAFFTGSSGSQTVAVWQRVGATLADDAETKNRAGKIRPNTVIISQSGPSVNGKMGGQRENLYSPQKRMCAFGEHSVLKSSDSRAIL